MIKKIFSTTGVVLLSFITLQMLNHLIIEKFIIGDPCKYDTEKIETGKVFDLFYTISSNTGYHPEPSAFNFYFTTFFSVLIALYISYVFIWKGKVQNENQVDGSATF